MALREIFVCGNAIKFSTMKRKTYQIIDDIKAVILSVLGIDPSMLLFPHVIFKCIFVPEGLLTVQALQANRNRQTLTDEASLSVVAAVSCSLLLLRHIYSF